MRISPWVKYGVAASTLLLATATLGSAPAGQGAAGQKARFGLGLRPRHSHDQHSGQQEQGEMGSRHDGFLRAKKRLGQYNPVAPEI